MKNMEHRSNEWNISGILLGISVIVAVLILLLHSYKYNNKDVDDIVNSTNPVIETKIDDYLLVDKRRYYYGGYTEQFILVYSTDDIIQDTLLLGDLEINYSSNKNELVIYDIGKNTRGIKEYKAIIYTTSSPKLEDKIVLDYFNQKRDERL